MIEGIVGYPGEGKTLLATFWGLQAMRQRRPVYSNFGLRGSYKVTPEMLMDFDLLPKALILVDEIQMWFTSRAVGQVPLAAFMPFMQGRKIGASLIWTAQHEKRVDRWVREVTQYLYVAHRIGPEGHPLALFRYDQYDGMDALSRTMGLEGLGTSYLWPPFVRLFGYDIHGAYSTQAIVREARYLARAFGREGRGVGAPVLRPGTDRPYTLIKWEDEADAEDVPGRDSAEGGAGVTDV